MSTRAAVIGPHDSQVGRAFQRMVHVLYATAVSTVAAMPLALLTVPGIPRLVGTLYALLYFALILFTSAPYLFLILDGALLAAGRDPVFLPIMVSSVRERHTVAPRRVLGAIDSLAKVAVLANPLANLAVVAILSAGQLRPNHFRRVWNEAASANAIRAEGRGPFVDPAMEINRPLMDVIAREDLVPC